MKFLPRFSRSAPLACLFVASLAAAHSAHAADIIVTTTDDEINNTATDGDGISLREAIRDVGTGDTITFDAGLNGLTIILGTNPGGGPTGSGQLLIDNSLTIDASALTNGITIDADDASRVMEIASNAPGHTVALHNLTITNGNADANFGGGIYNPDGTLTLDDVTLHNNSAEYGGGISVEVGTLTLNSATLYNNSADYGGAIDVLEGTLTLNNSIIAVNSADIYGGGINNEAGTLTLNKATLNNNSADYGGGVYVFDGTVTLNNTTLYSNSAVFYGGGISNVDGALTLNNTTLYSNSVATTGGYGGGIDAFGGTLTLNNSTLYDNFAEDDGGGLKNNSDSFTLNNTIIAGNRVNTSNDTTGDTSDGPDIVQAGGAVPITTGINLIGDIADSTLSAGPNVIVGTPFLAPFGNYGGPTQTVPPLPGSPAIDPIGGDATSLLSTDQRGESRIANSVVDIGAVEYQGAADLSPLLPFVWELDTDGDGNPFGIEFALGTDPFTPDPGHTGNLTAPVFSGGDATLTFGLNTNAAAHTVWILKRSTDLASGPFTEIYRYDGPTMMGTLGTDIASGGTATMFNITDENPPEGKAFYILKAQLAP